MSLWHYRYSGLSIVSEIPIPEWSAFETQVLDVPDIRVSLQEPAYSEEDSWFSFQEDGCIVRVPDVANYTVTGGSYISICPVPSARMREVRLFLLGSVWGALCYQRGLLPIHASVLRVGECAVAFCGDSGLGKSTTAAWLLERNYSLISDDLCLCHFCDGATPSVWPSTPRLKLWKETLEALGRGHEGLERDYLRAEKFHLSQTDSLGNSVPSASLLHPIPLRAIYLLGWGEFSLKRLTGIRALHRVVESATYRGDFLNSTPQITSHWERCTELVRHVPVWEWNRPKNWEQMNCSMRTLLRHWE